jgi:NADH:ubiquinone oxidoreductase subunit 6 (subunit J)
MFVVMLLGRASDLHLRQVNEFWMAALLICAIASVGLLKIARSHAGTLAAAAPSPSTRIIGKLFLGDYLVPFELVSLILLAALLGAVFFSHSDRAEAAK